MTLDTLGAFLMTPEFYSGLVTGALVAKTVQRTIGRAISERYGSDSA